MNIQHLREWINLRIFSSKKLVLQLLRILSFLVSMVAISSFLYYHGYQTTPGEKVVLSNIIWASLWFYVFKYVVGFFYSFEPKTYLRESKLEGIVMLLVVIETINQSVFGMSLISELGHFIGFSSAGSFIILFIQAYFMVIVGIELGKATDFFNKIQLSPPSLLIISFLILIMLGTLILTMPEMTVDGMGLPAIDALFTSISASCVTGLIVVDTATVFTFKGQLVIMFLIQLGGLNIISFATLFALFSKGGLGVKHQSLIKESLNLDNLATSSSLFWRIFSFSFTIEIIGAALMFGSWGDTLPNGGWSTKAFYSLFHSVSAFNNAGFALFTNGLAEAGVHLLWKVHLVIALLIILGSLGFGVITDVISVKGIKERLARPWKQLRLGTKLSLWSNFVLILLGFLVFVAMEWNNTLAGFSEPQRFLEAFFQSVTTRTAGFNTVDIAAISTPTIIVFFFLMFIGASPGSTGGGIKTTTFALVLLSAYSTIRGKNKLEMFRQTIGFDLLNKAFSIFLFNLSFIFLFTFLLTITDPQFNLLDLAFEEISAFSTVGLSRGITAGLSEPGRYVIMLSMFIGRIGTLTLFYSLSRPKKTNNYKYPKAQLMVG
jgi:potassium uptake TrkH family protein